VKWLQAARGQTEIREKEEILYCEGGEAQEQVAQRSCGCPSLEVSKVRLDGALSNLV